MKLRTITIALMFTALAAHAGKVERDFIASDVEPAIKEAAAAYKKSCGCDVKFDVKLDSYKDKDELFKIKYFAQAIKDGAPAYCTDAATKAAMCKLKSIEIQKTATADFKFSGGKGVATTDSSANPSWEMVTRAIDK
jgi:hypothetical protein